MGDSLADSELPPKSEPWAEANALSHTPLKDPHRNPLGRHSNSSRKSAHDAGEVYSGTNWAVLGRADQRSRPSSIISRKNDISSNPTAAVPPPAPPPNDIETTRDSYPAVSPLRLNQKPNIVYRTMHASRRFIHHTKVALCSSRVNYMLVFVPIGMAVKFTGVDEPIVFSMNALAVVPLANLLSYATENAAVQMGDTIGALLNITFGNAVEVIIFIALLKNEIRIVQAALIGSILSNMLLVMGTSFLLGGLHYREQVYNSTATQISAYLLSLSVMSLLLPTAFHASWRDGDLADERTLKISRGTSVVLLLVYMLYLLFILKTHSYLYASTPQVEVDQEAHPGLLANMMGSSTSVTTNFDDSDTEGSTSTHVPTKRFKIFKKMRRKSGTSSVISPSQPSLMSSPSIGSTRQVVAVPLVNLDPSVVDRNQRRLSNPVFTVSGDEADTDGENDSISRVRDFEAERVGSSASATKKMDVSNSNTVAKEIDIPMNGRNLVSLTEKFSGTGNSKSADGATQTEQEKMEISREPQTMNTMLETSFVPEDDTPPLSRTSAIVILLITTAFVAVCAEFLLDAIPEMLKESSISQAFIGLIVLPVIGNAAEMVTAVKFAVKNKMDLSIKVAFGSSIQIALFITPFVVLLGWCTSKEMTLYFTLFETISLFATAFVVNYLILDGRSNYLEGSLLIASFTIIGVAAFYYPDSQAQSQLGGSPL